MNIYKITQPESNNLDIFDGAIVIAKSVEEARLIHPSQLKLTDNVYPNDTSWTASENVQVELIGKLDDEYLVHHPNEINILSSFIYG